MRFWRLWMGRYFDSAAKCFNVSFTRGMRAPQMKKKKCTAASACKQKANKHNLMCNYEHSFLDFTLFLNGAQTFILIRISRYIYWNLCRRIVWMTKRNTPRFQPCAFPFRLSHSSLFSMVFVFFFSFLGINDSGIFNDVFLFSVFTFFHAQHFWLATGTQRVTTKTTEREYECRKWPLQREPSTKPYFH